MYALAMAHADGGSRGADARRHPPKNKARSERQHKRRKGPRNWKANLLGHLRLQSRRPALSLDIPRASPQFRKKQAMASATIAVAFIARATACKALATHPLSRTNQIHCARWRRTALHDATRTGTAAPIPPWLLYTISHCVRRAAATRASPAPRGIVQPKLARLTGFPRLCAACRRVRVGAYRRRSCGNQSPHRVCMCFAPARKLTFTELAAREHICAQAEMPRRTAATKLFTADLECAIPKPKTRLHNAPLETTLVSGKSAPRFLCRLGLLS